MRIGFVAEPYEENHASGMGFVVSEFLKELLVQGTTHEFVVYSSRPVSKTFIPGDYRFVKTPAGFFKKLRWFKTMPRDVDVLVFVAPFLPLVPPQGIRSVVLCQELGSQKVLPGMREWPFVILRDYILMPRCLKRSSVVVAASQATKSDILHHYRVPQEKIHVIYDGYQDLRMFKDSAFEIDQNFKPYFFFAGKVKWRKNVHGIAAAFVELKKRGSNVQLVIAGDYSGAYYEEILRILGRFKQCTHFVGYVSAPQLYTYYKNALAVVFPSLNEGFGMPIIEAMSLGTPVITSNISSMAEAAGDAALLVDPHDIHSISAAMEKIGKNPSVQNELVEKGLVRSKEFSWEKSTRELLTVIEHA